MSGQQPFLFCIMQIYEDVLLAKDGLACVVNMDITHVYRRH
jgi:hypothetical protein